MTGIRNGALPDRILDQLETDGGWMTTSAIYDLGLGNREAVHRALYQLRNLHNAVESRPRPASKGRWTENEWRAL